MPEDMAEASAVAHARLAAHREALLAGGGLTYTELQRLRGDPTQAAARAWASRQRRAGRLITVTQHGCVLVPAFQLRVDGTPRPELRPLIAELAAADVHGWGAFTWLTQPSAYLSGAVPSEVARTDPERVLRAAERFASAGVQPPGHAPLQGRTQG